MALLLPGDVCAPTKLGPTAGISARQSPFRFTPALNLKADQTRGISNLQVHPPWMKHECYRSPFCNRISSMESSSRRVEEFVFRRALDLEKRVDRRGQTRSRWEASIGLDIGRNSEEISVALWPLSFSEERASRLDPLRV